MAVFSVAKNLVIRERIVKRVVVLMVYGFMRQEKSPKMLLHLPTGKRHVLTFRLAGNFAIQEDDVTAGREGLSVANLDRNVGAIDISPETIKESFCVCFRHFASLLVSGLL